MSTELSIADIPALQETIAPSGAIVPRSQVNTAPVPDVSSSLMMPPISQSGPIATPVDNDINVMIARIREHMRDYSMADKLNISQAPAKTLKIPTANGNVNEISDRCLLAFMSQNPGFLTSDRERCSNVFVNYLSNGSVDLNKLIDLSMPNGNIVRDAGFYGNLYGFCIDLVLFLTGDEFKAADPVTKQNVVNGVYNFVDQTIKYLNKAIDTYKVMDIKLANSGFDLLYLLNLLNLKRVSVGNTPDDLMRTYAALQEATKRNIDAYTAIMNQGRPAELAISKDPVIDELEKAMQSKITELDRQLKILQENVKLVEKEKTSLVTLVTNKDILKIDPESFSR